MSYASASFIERIIEAIRRRGSKVVADGRTKLDKMLVLIARFHDVISKEDKVVNFVKLVGLNVLRLQSSLEDSLSALSLLLELFSSLSVIIVLVVLWWSY